VFLIRRDENGKLRFFGGAGGAPCVGGAVGLWPASILIILPVGAAVLFGIGYASIATMSAALIAGLVFAGLALLGLSPWQYIFYGVIAELLLVWALRPNIQRLMNGTERGIGWRAKRQQKTQA
jgi:glycerol-3-phosphate acyltransferase PlsY